MINRLLRLLPPLRSLLRSPLCFLNSCSLRSTHRQRRYLRRSHQQPRSSQIYPPATVITVIKPIG
ncbi:hypothetical protein HanIR_Chr10g0474451 [Helianthus annuus]|nr:hypothetical protein HanIR_Chr10g0474451 [Helianthus annuus]